MLRHWAQPSMIIVDATGILHLSMALRQHRYLYTLTRLACPISTLPSPMTGANINLPTMEHHPMRRNNYLRINPLQQSYLFHSTTLNQALGNKSGDKGGFFSKLFKRKRYTDSHMLHLGYGLYSNIATDTDVLHFFKVLSLEDTFFSWFLVMQLQVWLVCVRLGKEGDEGRIARDGVIRALWEDIQARTKDIGIRSKNKSRDMDEMNATFQTALVSYDEGLQGSDKDLACAVWRCFIRTELQDQPDEEAGSDTDEGSGGSRDTSAATREESSKPRAAGVLNILDHKTDPRALESIVCYIRRQVHAFDNISSDKFLDEVGLSWLKPDLPGKL